MTAKNQRGQLRYHDGHTGKPFVAFVPLNERHVLHLNSLAPLQLHAAAIVRDPAR